MFFINGWLLRLPGQEWLPKKIEMSFTVFCLTDDLLTLLHQLNFNVKLNQSSNYISVFYSPQGWTWYSDRYLVAPLSCGLIISSTTTTITTTTTTTTIPTTATTTALQYAISGDANCGSKTHFFLLQTGVLYCTVSLKIIIKLFLYLTKKLNFKFITNLG